MARLLFRACVIVTEYNFEYQLELQLESISVVFFFVEKMSQKTKSSKRTKELTKSPISGTYIIKDWNHTLKLQTRIRFSRADMELEKLAGNFVKITPETRAKLQSIPNLIGPYECKLCQVIYADAFELAKHNCPRVVHIEYKLVHITT